MRTKSRFHIGGMGTGSDDDSQFPCRRILVFRAKLQKCQAIPGKNDRIVAIHMRRFARTAFFIALITGCASRAVVKGALSPQERQEYVEQTGALIPQRLKEPFMEGKPTEGMSKEMIVFLYGQPDRTENNRYGITWSGGEGDAPPTADNRDSIWNYFGTDSVSIKRGLVFRGDTLVRFNGDLAK